jgi:DNA-binding transcriptional LysR family regulator
MRTTWARSGSSGTGSDANPFSEFANRGGVRSATLPAMRGPSWDDLRVLLALHEQRSFLAAGKVLGLSTSTVARRIDALEQSLGRAVVRRTSAGTTLEPEALSLVALAEQMSLGLSTARRGQRSQALAGTVRISAGEGFVRPLTALLSSLRRREPEVFVEVLVETRLVDLARREADIGLRKVRSRSKVLIERPVGRLRFGLYAAPDYIERRWGTRQPSLTAAGLPAHDFVGFDKSLQGLPQAAFLTDKGAHRLVFRSNSDQAQLDAVEQGQGIGVLPCAVADVMPTLVRIPFDATLPSAPIFLVYHRDVRRVPCCRFVLDALAPALRQGLATA